MDNKFISVRVSGNPAPNGGFGSLIMFNNPRFELKDVFYGGFENNSYYFSIRIEQSQVVYKIIKNNVRSHGAIRAGALSLAFSIPKGYKVDGFNPYEVLMDLLDTFLKNCMTCRDEQAGTYEFNDVRVPLDALDETAQKYTLIESKSPWHTMSNDDRIGCIQADEIQIEQLINDVQYDEFKKYSEVLIAENVGDNCTFNRITGLEIPRRPVYTIVVDNNSNSIIKTKEIDKPFYIEPKVDSRYYEWEPIKFTISELLNGDCVKGVVPNRAEEIINVSTASYKQPKIFNIRVVFTPEENKAAKYLHKGQITIRYNRHEVSLNNDFVFTLKGEEYGLMNRLDLFKITAPESLDIEFDAMPTFDSEKKELKWGTKKKEKQKPADSDSTAMSLVSTGEDKHKAETHSSDVFKLVFAVEISKQNKTIIESIYREKSKLVVKNDASGETISKNILPLSSVNKKSQFKSNASNNSTYLMDIIRIPKPLNQKKYIVDLHIGNKKYTTNFDYFEEKLVEGCWVVKFSDFKQSPKPIKNVIMPNRVIAFLEGFVLCALLIGGCKIIKSSFGNDIKTSIKSFFGNDNKTPAVQGTEDIDSNSVKTDALEGYIEITDDSIQHFLNKSDSILKKKDLLFDKVDEIYGEYESKGIDRCKKIDSVTCKRIEEYKNVADYIRDKDYNRIVNYINQPNKKINKYHFDLVKLITNGVASGLDFDNYDYKNFYGRICEVKQYFQDNKNVFRSFLDLLKIARTYPKPKPKPGPRPAVPKQKDKLQRYGELEENLRKS